MTLGTDLPVIFVLTKLDVEDKTLANSVENILDSTSSSDQIDQFCSKGIPRELVFPVVNIAGPYITPNYAKQLLILSILLRSDYVH